jgi:hypothetical protein
MANEREEKGRAERASGDEAAEEARRAGIEATLERMEQAERLSREFWLAARSGDAEKIAALMAQGLDPSGPRDERMVSGLMLAALSGKREAIRFLAPYSELDARDEFGSTALMFAANSGLHETADELLKMGASATLADSDGDTALHIASARGWQEVVQVLAPKSDLEQKNNAGRTPEQEAQWKPAVIEALRIEKAARERAALLAEAQRAPSASGAGAAGEKDESSSAAPSRRPLAL